MNPVPKEERELEQLVDFEYDHQVGSVAIIETSTGSALGRGATDTDALRDALITVTNRRDPNMDFGSRRWLSHRYGIPSAKAAQITPEIRAQVEDWREQNGLPATSSPLTRGYLLDLLAKEDSMNRNPRGIYHGTEAGKNDFVIHEHRGAFWVDLVFAGGTHLNISPARGYRDLDEALEGIADTAHTRSIRRYNIFRQDDAAGEMRMIGNPHGVRPRPPRPGRRPLVPPHQPAAVLSSVRTIVHREERAPFDPERRYARETKPHHFAVNRRRLRRNSDSATRNAIVEGAASGFFVSAWADGAEEAGHSFAGGTRLEDEAPPVPRELERFAEKFVRSVEKLNRQSISDLYMEHAEASGRHEFEPSPSAFGHYLAMASLGHGTSWYDYHDAPAGGEVVLPSTEVYVDVSPDDIDSVDVNYAELSERLAR